MEQKIIFISKSIDLRKLRRDYKIDEMLHKYHIIANRG